ncbi:hypothetical protein ACU8KH_05360 [Lachancea thermotolerans]
MRLLDERQQVRLIRVKHTECAVFEIFGRNRCSLIPSQRLLKILFKQAGSL